MIPLLASLFAALLLLRTLRMAYQVHFHGDRLRDGDMPLSQLPSLTVVVPARNEERNIGTLLESLIRQEYPEERLRVVVVDDGSTDGTARIVAEYAARSSQVRLVKASPLSGEWAGKPHACWEGARFLKSEYLCFLDADTIAKPGLLRSAVAAMERRNLDVVSVNPFQILESLAERCLMPGIFLGVAANMDFARINDSRAYDAVGNGQCFVFRRSAYQRMGGHYAVRSEVVEDVALARLAKRSCLRYAFLFGEPFVATRMYSSVEGIWSGFSKGLVELLPSQTPMRVAVSSITSLLAAWLPLGLVAMVLYELSLPPWAWSAYSAAGSAVAAAGVVGMVVAWGLTLAHLRTSLLYLLCFPIGLTCHALLVINSFAKSRFGVRKWKDREYPSSHSVPPFS